MFGIVYLFYLEELLGGSGDVLHIIIIIIIIIIVININASNLNVFSVLILDIIRKTLTTCNFVL